MKAYGRHSISVGSSLPSFLSSFFLSLAGWLFSLTTFFWLPEYAIHSNDTDFSFGIFINQTLCFTILGLLFLLLITLLLFLF